MCAYPASLAAALAESACSAQASDLTQRLSLCVRQRNPQEVIQQLQKEHAFAMSDCEQGTTIGFCASLQRCLK
jgi:hypothetical protein